MSFPTHSFLIALLVPRQKGLPSGFRDATEAVAFAMDFLQPWRDSPASNRTGPDP
ncbi:hypothetical protein [Mesorhizobium sp. M2A.F.Ca.ET.042.01.1.1]|uniref:hypothetical protein n=1 Tax=Mesorhizobium sp. M2A.F.Ca.ET.042.01.1.1 TaxID=2496745 RepID=UPI001679B188|nr:hypothetical protein [Mesorhizobium sp. M2A.F.Ca.ET.042.01.1.1]